MLAKELVKVIVPECMKIFRFFEFPWKHLLRALHMYLLITVPFIVICVIAILFCFLSGRELFDLVSFARDYFYDGKFLGSFIAWKIHLVFLVFCILMSGEDV